MNATPEPSRLLVAGDVHGNVGWFRRLCDLAGGRWRFARRDVERYVAGGPPHAETHR
jgi:hypothetical protein